MDKLESSFGMPRAEWPPNLLRTIADALIKAAPYRNATTEHASRWWNLTGFTLRPGFGYPLDDFRIKELWKIILSSIKTPIVREVQIQTWICYRRVAGGLGKGQQMQLAAELFSELHAKTGRLASKSKSDIYIYSEKVRALAAFELIDASLKKRLGKSIIERLCSKEGIPAEYWALGRLGARRLFYGSIGHVMPKEACELWIGQLLEAPLPADERLALLFRQLACKTEHAEINISPTYIRKILSKFADSGHLSELEGHLNCICQPTIHEREQAFGDTLPAGLSLDLQDRGP